MRSTAPVKGVRDVAVFALFGILLAGCPSPALLKEHLARLDQAQARLVELSTELERFKRHAGTEIDALKREQERLGRELVQAQTRASDARTELQSNEYHLSNERLSREQVEQLNEQLAVDRRVLADKAAYLEGRVDRMQEELNRAQEAHGRTAGRLEVLEREHASLTQEVAEARNTIVQTEQALRAARRQLGDATKFRREAEARASRVEDRARRSTRLAEQVAALKASLSSAAAKISALEGERERVGRALATAKARATALESLLAKEREVGHEREKTFQRLQRPVETPTR